MQNILDDQAPLHAEEAQQALAPFLVEDEALVWAAQPLPTIYLNQEDKFMIFIGIGFCGVSIVFGVMSFFGGQMVGIVVSILFLLIGLLVFFSKFWKVPYERRFTYYGLSSQRLLVLYKGKNIIRKDDELRTYKVATLEALELIEEGKGQGSLVFDGRCKVHYLNSGNNVAIKVGGAKIEAIPDVIVVYDSIKALQNEPS